MQSQRGKNRKVRLEQVAEYPNLLQADHDARRGKKNHKGVKLFDRNAEGNLKALSKALLEGTYHTSEGHECVRLCPCGKKRILHKLPYYPDHIGHHALMQIVQPYILRSLYYESAASVKGKGMHFVSRRVKRWIDEHKKAEKLYFVKLDFVKFYHKIDQDKLYNALCKKFSDKGIRYLFHEVTHCCKEGLGIGLYPVQTLANFYTSPMCREVVAKYDVKLFIYCDDIVVISENKRQVWKAINYIQHYASDIMCQPLHDNIGMQVLDHHHSLDFIGYQFFIDRVLLRKKMKKKFKRAMHRLKDPMHRYRVVMAYKGWLQHCNGFNLWRHIMGVKKWSDIELPEYERRDKNGRRILEGNEVNPKILEGRNLVFLDCEEDVETKNGKRMYVQLSWDGTLYKFCTNDGEIKYKMSYAKQHKLLPLEGTIACNNIGRLTKYSIV